MPMQAMNEAEKIYYSIFRKEIPAPLQSHFENVLRRIDERYPEEEIKKYHRCIAEINDIEALELAARYFKKLRILSEKFKIMVYLAETLPENYTVFISEKNNSCGGYISIMASLSRTVYKFTKGTFLFMVHRL